MRLLNVRLGDEDAEKADVLRRRGVQISSLVRQAIRAEYERHSPRVSKQNVRKLLADIHAAHPDPEGLPPREFDVHDRRAFREAMARHVRRATQ